MVRWYVRDENGVRGPVSVEEYSASLGNSGEHYRRVARDVVDDVAEVSTVFLGLDRNHFGGPPLIFETMVFGGEWDCHQWRYSTEEQALAGHATVLDALRKGRNPNEAMES